MEQDSAALFKIFKSGVNQKVTVVADPEGSQRRQENGQKAYQTRLRTTQRSLNQQFPQVVMVTATAAAMRKQAKEKSSEDGPTAEEE